jgi:hypothetical protein
MRRRQPPAARQVELIGVPHYMQGHADGLCVYYSMTMMLAALFPEVRPVMHDSPRYKFQGGPIFQAFRSLAEEKDHDFGTRFTRWFFGGMQYSEALDVLNHAGGRLANEKERRLFIKKTVHSRRATKFRYNRQRAALLRRWTVDRVLDVLDNHLPVMIGGTDGDLDHHAVVAVGYRAGGGEVRELLFHDPATGRTESKATSAVFCPAEVIVPLDDAFQDYRPDLVVTEDGASRVERWRRARVATEGTG